MSHPDFPLPPDSALSPEDAELLSSIPPANIFRAVANTTSSLSPFIKLAQSVLWLNSFDQRLRELAVLRIATVTDSKYEWIQHVGIAKWVGVTDDEIQRIAAPGPVSGFAGDDLLVIEAAEDLTRNVRLRDDLLEALLDRFGSTKTSEFILCAAYFNMVSRFLESVRVPLEETPIL